MLSVTHTLVSLPIGAAVQQPVLSFLLALLLHLFADTLLHWNIYLHRHRRPYLWAAVDVAAALGIAWLLVPDRFLTAPMVAAIIGGNAPDLWQNSVPIVQRVLPVPRWLGKENPLLRFHSSIQDETDTWWKGVAWQVVLGAAALWLLRT